MQLSKKPKCSSEFFMRFQNLNKILNVLKHRRWASQLTYLRYYWHQKTRLLKRLKDIFGEYQTLLSSPRKQCYPFDSSFRDELSWKMSLLVRFEILGEFVHTLSADIKYSHHYRNNFEQHIQIQLSKKPNFLLNILLLLRSFHLKKKSQPHSLSICDIIDSEGLDCLNV